MEIPVYVIMVMGLAVAVLGNLIAYALDRNRRRIEALEARVNALEAEDK